MNTVSFQSGKNRITFQSKEKTLVGHLYLPADYQEGKTYPAAPILGPMTFVKEQAPTQYASRLAERGFVGLAFDPRYRGESGGEPRTLEDPRAKVDDARAAARYLASLPMVDSAKIAGLAVCQGSSEMLRAVAEDDIFQALATVAGHYRDHEADIQWMGSEEALSQRREAGQAAQDTYKKSGEVMYVPAVDETRTDVGMPGKFVYDWYISWAKQGVWENNYAKMSDARLLAYESLTAAQQLNKPYLMIHSDNCFLPDAARRQFEAVPTEKKKLKWEDDTNHFQYYDDPNVLNKTADQVVAWYNRVL